MNLSAIKYVYMLGIGGIGMSALARYFNKMGKTVAGYDRTPTSLTTELQKEGIEIVFTDHENELPQFFSKALEQELIVVYTPAIPAESNLYRFLLGKFEMFKRSKILGWLTENTKTIAIAGTHGKTTTSTMVAHIMHYCNYNCTAFLGGISVNLGSNLLLGNPQHDDHVVVVEADEFDRSFLTLYPYIAIVTSTDADHLDIYGDHRSLIESYEMFCSQVNHDGKLVMHQKLNLKAGATKVLRYDTLHAPYSAQNIRIDNHEYVFDYVSPDRNIKNIRCGMPGRHNVENAVAAITALLEFNFTNEQISQSVQSYKGVRRRFEFRIKSETLIYIDDYAHHPEEIKAVIESIKELYPGKKLTAIFQPHLYSRTRDFASGFVQSLSLADEVILLPLYPAREKPLEGVNSEMLLQMIETKKSMSTKESLVNHLSQMHLEVVLTIGAGDIDQVVLPVQTFLEANLLNKIEKLK